MQISQIRPECGCTVTGVREAVIAPGKELAVPVRVHLTGRRGKQQFRVVVKSNDPDRPFLILTLNGEVESHYVIKPERVDFGKQNEPQRHREHRGKKHRETELNTPTAAVMLEIRSADTTAFHIQKVWAEKVKLKIEQETVQAGKAYRLKIKPAADVAAGAMRGIVRIRTDVADEPEIIVPVVGEVEKK